MTYINKFDIIKMVKERKEDKKMNTPYITTEEIRNTSDETISLLIDELIAIANNNEAVKKLLEEYEIEFE